MLTTFFIRVLNETKDGFGDSDELRPHLKAVADEFDAVLKDASDYHSLGKISEQVTEAIQTSDVVFADANSANENVWYEIGYADKTNARKVVCLYKRGRVLPFDRTDMRSIQYDPTTTGFDALRVQLSRVLSDLLCDKRLREILAQDKGPTLASDYLSSLKLRKVGIEWLIDKLHNTHEAETLRIASLKALAALSAISTEILTELLQPLVKGNLRMAAYQQAAEFEGALPDEVWVVTPELVSAEAGKIRDAYCFAIVKHWLNGYLDPDRVRQIIVDTSERGLRGGILMAIQRAIETNPAIIGRQAYIEPTPV